MADKTEKKKKYVLVIDDDPDITRMLQMMLEYEGYTVARAHGTAQGMALLSADVPDLVVLDFMLPHLTGAELCSYMRRDPRTASVPVVIYSALTTEEAEDAAMKAGATRYVPKTVAREELLKIIKDMAPA